MTLKRHWPLALFLVLVLPLSWYQFLIRGSSASDSGINPLGPLVAALIVCGVSGHFREYIKRIVRVRVAPSTYALALGTPILLCLISITIATFSTGTPVPFAEAQANLLTFVDSFLIAFLFVALGEEPGWRGYLFPALSKISGPVVAALIISPIWFIWHYPLMGTQLSYDLLFPFFLSVIGGSLFLSWLTLRSKGAVLPAMLCHGMLNGIGANYLYPLFDGEARTIIQWSNFLLWFAIGIYAAYAMQREYRPGWESGAARGDIAPSTI